MTSSTWRLSPVTSVSPTSTCSGYTVMCGERPVISGNAIISPIATINRAPGR